MAFAFLLAAIHWFDFFTGDIGWMSPVYNSIPFTILLVCGVESQALRIYRILRFRLALSRKSRINFCSFSSLFA